MQDLSILLETGATTPPEPEGGHKFETSQDFASFGQILKNAGDEPSINEEVKVSSQGSTNSTDLQNAIPVHNSMEENPVGFESGEISFDQSEVFDISDEYRNLI